MRLLAAGSLALHLLWILWVIFGAVWTRRRPWLAAFHVASIVWGIAAEVGPWPCPLTLAENWFEAQAGIQPYSGGFLIHYLDAIVYPNTPAWLLESCAVVICAANLALYARRLFLFTRRRRPAHG